MATATDSAYSIALGFGVGMEKVDLVGSYSSDGGLTLELDRPATTDTLKNILAPYLKPETITSLPDFVQKALDVRATIQHLRYKTVPVATATANNGAVTAISSKTLPTALASTKLKEIPGSTKPAKPTTWQVVNNNDVALDDYSVTKESDAKYNITQKQYVFVVTAYYDTPLPIVEGLLYFKFIGFGISKDPEWTTDKLNGSIKKITQDALDKAKDKKEILALAAQNTGASAAKAGDGASSAVKAGDGASSATQNS